MDRDAALPHRNVPARWTLIATLVVASGAVGCGRGPDLCGDAARAAQRRVAGKDGMPAVRTQTDVAADRLAVTMATRCREDGWSKPATACLAAGDLRCWRAALSTAQADALDEAMQTMVDELRAPTDAP